MGGDVHLPALFPAYLAYILLAPEVADGLIAVEAELERIESHRTLLRPLRPLLSLERLCGSFGYRSLRVSVCGRAACARTCLACKYSNFFRKTAGWPCPARLLPVSGCLLQTFPLLPVRHCRQWYNFQHH